MCNLFREVADLAEVSQNKYDMVMTRIHELKRELAEASVVCESNVVPPSKQSTNILDPKGIRRKGRPPCNRKKDVVEKAMKKKSVQKKNTLSDDKAKEIAVVYEFGTQESVANVNSHPSYMGQSMWPNMMPHYMQATMMQGGHTFPFPTTICPTGTSLNKFVSYFPSSENNMANLCNDQVWIDQPTIADSQIS
ncbi:hypothetical protein Dimus_004894 [Dionaea muscipula]